MQLPLEMIHVEKKTVSVEHHVTMNQLIIRVISVKFFLSLITICTKEINIYSYLSYNNILKKLLTGVVAGEAKVA
jgi:hypothetical protein